MAAGCKPVADVLFFTARIGVRESYLTMSEGPVGGKPQNNVYTVLLILGAILTAVATIYLSVRSQHLFGSWHPFGGA